MLLIIVKRTKPAGARLVVFHLAVRMCAWRRAARRISTAGRNSADETRVEIAQRLRSAHARVNPFILSRSIGECAVLHATAKASTPRVTFIAAQSRCGRADGTIAAACARTIVGLDAVVFGARLERQGTGALALCLFAKQPRPVSASVCRAGDVTAHARSGILSTSVRDRASLEG